MGLIANSAALKAYSEQITSPRLTAVDATPYIRPSRQAFASNSPFYRAEKNLTRLNPDIKPGEELYDPETFSIVHKYQNDAEKKEEERKEKGGLTDLELYQAITFAINSISYPPTYLSVEQPSYKIVVPPNYTAGAKFSGSDGKSYTPILDESGKTAYLDSFASCVMNVGGWSATTKPMANDDLISKSQIYNITFKVDDKGNETRRTHEDANFQLAMTRIDNKYTVLPYQLDGVNRFYAEMAGSNTFKSAAPSGIKTDTKPAEPFASAVAATDAAPAAKKSIMFKAREPLPWEKSPVAANAPVFEPAL